MRLNFTNLFLLIIGLLVIDLTDLQAQEKNKENYGKTPDELLPFSHFQEPYKQFFTYPSQPYRGPNREKPEPKGLTEVRIGFLGPLEGSPIVDYGIQMVQGAQLAIDEANVKGGYKGLPYVIMPHNDVGLWGASANEVVKMDDEGVWAIIGSIDDIVTHVAIRVALKLEIPVVNAGDPDPTLTETNIPWVLRVISDDRQSSYALTTYMYQEKDFKRVAVLRVNNRYGRVGTGEFKDASERMGRPVLFELRFEDGDTDFTSQLENIKKSSADAIALWGNPKELGMIVNKMREMGMEHPVFACDRIVNPKFIEYAGKENAEGIVTTCQYLPDMNNPIYKRFHDNYVKKYKMEPDVFAAHAYDGTNLVIESIKKAGLNRAKIRDLLLDLETYQGYEGVTGKLEIDPSWNDVGEIWLVKIEKGDFKFYPKPKFKSEKVQSDPRSISEKN
jgi:ABC-type branched-subunit amino acid transport system substrate-binding protein